jgi:U1 small nuclear ribonucleoprotein
MTKYLPPNLMALFEPRPPIDYLPPIEKRKMPSLSGVASFTNRFEDPRQVQYPHVENNTGIVPLLSELKERKRKRKQATEQEKLTEMTKQCTCAYPVSLQHGKC